MSEQPTADVSATDAEATAEQADTETKPTETVEFWKAKAREQEKRAKDNATAAKRLADIEESQKTEAQKSADRIKQLEEEATAARRDALRFKVASKHGIGDEDTDLFLTGSDEETLTKQAERLAGRTADRMKQGNRVSAEGTNPTASSNNDASFASNLLGG